MYRWFYNSDVYIHQQLCTVYNNLPGYVYSAGCISSNINLPGKYNYGSLSITSADQYCFCCLVSYCISQWWLQQFIDKQ